MSSEVFEILIGIEKQDTVAKKVFLHPCFIDEFFHLYISKSQHLSIYPSIHIVSPCIYQAVH